MLQGVSTFSSFNVIAAIGNHTFDFATRRNTGAREQLCDTFFAINLRSNAPLLGAAFGLGLRARVCCPNAGAVAWLDGQGLLKEVLPCSRL